VPAMRGPDGRGADRNPIEERMGRGVQLFRIRHPGRHFEQLADLGPLHGSLIGGRRVWRIRGTDVFYALLVLPFEGDEEILVRAPDGEWEEWDWAALAAAAEGCRWRGPELDARWVD
jgi:hypothetical protein